MNSEVARLQDEIRIRMSRIATGVATEKDRAEVQILMKRRSQLMYEHGLAVAKANSKGKMLK